MKNRKPATRQRRHGFTLTELLIVMAILVLLVSLVGPRLLGSKEKADINTAKTQIGMFKSSLERYALDMNRFPSTEQGLKALVSAPAADSTGGEESFDEGMDDEFALEEEGEESSLLSPPPDMEAPIPAPTPTITRTKRSNKILVFLDMPPVSAAASFDAA